MFQCFSNAFYNFLGIKIFVFLALWWNQFWNAGLVPAADTCSTRRTLKNRQMAGTEERGRAKGDLLRDRGKVLSSVHLLRARIYFLTSDPWLKGRLKLSYNSKHSTYFKSVILWYTFFRTVIKWQTIFNFKQISLKNLFTQKIATKLWRTNTVELIWCYQYKIYYDFIFDLLMRLHLFICGSAKCRVY